MGYIAQSTEDIPGPEVQLNCPRCRAVGGAATFEHVESLLLFWFIPIAKVRNVYCRCLACGATLRVRMPFAELGTKGGQDISHSVVDEASFVAKFFAVAGLLLSIVPLVGIWIALFGLAANFRTGRWPRTISVIGVVIGLLVHGVGYWVLSYAEAEQHRREAAEQARRAAIAAAAPAAEPEPVEEPEAPRVGLDRFRRPGDRGEPGAQRVRASLPKEWIDFAPEKGNFTAKFPGRRPQWLERRGPDDAVLMARLDHPDLGTFLISQTTLPKQGLPAERDQQLAEIAGGTVSGTSGEKLEERFMQLQEHRVLDLRFQGSARGKLVSGHLRFMIVDDWIYQWGWLGDRDAEPQAEVKQFFSSFALTPPPAASDRP